jgi:type II secretory pathway component GspD/PulD (secretin)
VIEDYRTNSLIVTDTPAQIEVIAELIAALDKPAEQVMLEVEMLDVSKNAVDRLGMNWPATLLSLTVSGSRETSFPFGSMGTDGGGRSLDPDDNAFGGGWDFGSWDATRFGPSILTVIGTTLTLDFLRSQTDTRFLARPKLLTLNNEPAEIRIATNEAIGVKTTTTDTTTTAEPERAETGVILRVTPQINPDTGEITMFIYPKVAEAVAGSTFTSDGDEFQYRDPEERSTKSVVRIRDGNTVVIGGLIRNEYTLQQSKLPFFGDLPVVGWIFKHKGGTATAPDKDKQRELLVFITPRIIRDNDTSLNKLSPDVQPIVPDREQTILQENRQTLIDSSLNRFEGSKSR